MTAPTNAQVDNSLSRVHDECYADPVFCEKVLGDHPAPWLRLRAQRAAAPPALQLFDQKRVQETLGNTPRCKPTLTCALNSCRVVFATAGMVANQHRLFLGAAPGRPQTRFAFSFVDEASRHSIPVGLDLAAMGSQCLCVVTLGICGPTTMSSFWLPLVEVIHRLRMLHAQQSRRSHTTMWICNPFAPMCTGMIHNGFAPPAPCNCFCTAHSAVPVSWYNSTG